MAKGYNFNLVKRYKVTFIKDASFYKKDDEVEIGMALAAKFVREGKISPTPELLADAKELKCEEAFSLDKRNK